MTGFSARVRAQLHDRSGSICEVCGMQPAREAHHRRARGAGGTKRPESNLSANGLMLCTGCHRMVEQFRSVALTCGWLVPQHEDPANVAVIRRGELKFFDDEGGMRCAN